MPVTLDRSICERYFTYGNSVAVALSGGADSVCLCSLLCKLAREKGFTLTALHLNHMIRGDEADRDERFCQELCESLSVRLIVHRADVPALARERGQSLEEAAREARYSFFEETMRREGIHVIATAHNADDNAETVLFRLIRGTSLDGICGIRAERELSDGLMTVRPILGASKRDILSYCEENRLSYVTDSTNACTDYPRNRIRANILPEAEAIDPAFLAVNRRNCELFSRDADFIGREAELLYGSAADGDRLSVRQLSGKHRALTSRVIARFMLGCGARPESKHVEMLCDAVDKGSDFSLSVPSGMKAVIEDGYVRVCTDIRRKKKRKAEESGYTLSLCIGDNEYRQGGLSLYVGLEIINDGDKSKCFEKYSHDSELIYTLSTYKTLNFDTINGSLFARPRTSGDSVDLGTFHKDVRRAMSEKKVPEPLRGAIPMICDGEGIVYAPTVGCSKRVSGKGTLVLGITVRLTLRDE